MFWKFNSLVYLYISNNETTNSMEPTNRIFVKQTFEKGGIEAVRTLIKETRENMKEQGFSDFFLVDFIPNAFAAYPEALTPNRFAAFSQDELAILFNALDHYEESDEKANLMHQISNNFK